MSGQYPARTPLDDMMGRGRESVHPKQIAETGRQFLRIPHQLGDILRPMTEWERFQWIAANQGAWVSAVLADKKFTWAEQAEALKGFQHA